MNTKSLLFLSTLIIVIVVSIFVIINVPASTFTGKKVNVCTLTINVDYWFYRDPLQGDHLADVKITFISSNWHEKKLVELSIQPFKFTPPLWFEETVTVRWIIQFGSFTQIYDDQIIIPLEYRLGGGFHRTFTITFQGVEEGTYSFSTKVNYPIFPDRTYEIFQSVTLQPT